MMRAQMFCAAILMMALQVFKGVISCDDRAMFAGGLHMQVSSLV